MADHRWQGYSHKELYERIHSGPGASASFASMERWQGVSAALSEINDDLHSGITLSGAKWSGKAADMAQAGLNPIAAWADSARTGSDVMRYSAELQAGYVSKARADMPAPVNVTAEQPGALVSGITHLFGGQTDHEKQEAAQDAAERRAREVMSTYASSTTANTSTLGQFSQPPQLQISGSGTVHGGGAQVGTATVWGVGPHGTGGSATRGRTSTGSRGTVAPPPRGGTPAPGSTTRTSNTGTSSTPLVKGSHNSVTTGSTGPGGTGTGTAGVGVPGQRTGSRSGSGAGSEVKQMEDGATAASGAAAAGAVMNHGQAAGVANGAGSAMGALGTVGAQNNDQVHRRAVPMPQSFDPFGGMGNGRKGEEEEDLEHKAADYLRERDDIYGVGSYTLPVIGGEHDRLMTLFGLDAGASDTRDPVVISTLEFDVLWDHLGLEMMPLVLKVPSPGKTTEERRAIEDRVWLQLGARGLGGPRSLDPMLEDLLHVLNRPQQEVDARMWLHERSLRVLAAGKGQAGVLAILDGTQLILRPAEADGLPREALTALPNAPAGEGHSITLPSANLDAAAASAGSPEELEDALRGHLRADDAHTLAEMVRDASNRGQFGAAARDKWGKRVRPDRVVAFYDTPKGRYLQMRRATEGQEPWSTVTPVDYRRLHHHLVELLAEAAGS